MSGIDDDTRDGGGSYASPPCLMHEVDPAYMGFDAQQQQDVARWRRSQRARLIDTRLALPNAERVSYAEVIMSRLDEIIGGVQGRVVSAYWPMRGEPDLRVWLEELGARGCTAALPVVVQKRAPLIFRAWRKGAPLDKGEWDIPVPFHGADVVIPDVIVAPIVGFDRNCYRLGYGGGYFNRTLGLAKNRPLVIGVGYSAMELPTIYPQTYDVPMDIIVTEQDVVRR